MIAPVDQRVSSTGIENSFAVEENGEVLVHLANIAMSIQIDTGIEFPHGNLEQADKSTLIQIIQTLAGEVSSLKGEVSSLKGEVSSLREDSDRAAREIADTNGRLSETREDVDRVSKKVADTNSRVSEVEDEIDEVDSTQSSEDRSSPSNPKGKRTESTALEQICALSEDESDEHLTANQSRARKVARRIDEYGKSVPAGIAITSSRMRDFLSGLEDKRIHRQSIQRVIDFLERFGDEHVNKRETRGGKTVVVFSETVVERIKSVVTGDENTTVTPTIL